MGFTYAGNLGGAGAPTVLRLQTGETCYNGQLVQADISAANGGHVQIADVASEASEDDLPIVGMITAIADESRTYVASSSGTAQYGDRSTYTITQSTIAGNLGTKLSGGGEVDVTLIIPGVTLVKAPIYDAAWGTALTEMVVTTASSGGVTITATGDAVTDVPDDLATIFCRSGANRGHSRIVTTGTSTTVRTVVIPFPYGIAVDDVFVQFSGKLGKSHMDIPATADCIDGDNDLNAYYDVFYHEINLEETGKEYAIFSLYAGHHIHS